MLTTFAAVLSITCVAPARSNVVAEWNAISAACTAAHRPGPGQLLELAVVQAAVHNAV